MIEKKFLGEQKAKLNKELGCLQKGLELFAQEIKELNQKTQEGLRALLVLQGELKQVNFLIDKIDGEEREETERKGKITSGIPKK